MSLARESFVTLRDASANDLSAITEIYGREVAEGTASFELTAPNELEMARRMQELRAADLPYLIAESDGAVVGYAYAGPYRPRPAYAHTVECSVYVGAARRGQGVGRLLLKELIDRCTTMGKRQMVAVIGDRDNVGSIRLHSALGFRLAGRLESVGFKHGRWLDSILMQRSLGQGDLTAPSC